MKSGLADDIGNHRVHLRRIPNVNGGSEHARSIGAKCLGAGLEMIGVAAGNRDRRAEASKCARDRESDPGAAACHDSGLSLKNRRGKHKRQVYCQMVRFRNAATAICATS